MFAVTIRPEILKRLREEYPPGTEVELIEMCDPYREMPPGLCGKIIEIDDAGTAHIAWSNGSSLGAVHGIDRFRRVD